MEYNNNPIVKSKIKRYEKAKATRENWVPLFEECYEYALPMRESFYYEEVGQRRDDRIFDETAVVGVQEFASRLQSGLVPNFARWADLLSGSEVPEEERDKVDNVLDTGPDDKIDHVFRERKKVPFDSLPIMYPNGKFDAKLKQMMGRDADTTILEVVCRDYTKKNEEAYYHYALCMTTKTIVHEKEMKGLGSNPFVCFRWSKCAGEVYGRGPLLNALSAIKTTNLTIELILENAQMSIAGIYQVDDDGVINPDTINLVPGSIIPKAMGSSGLQPLQAAGNFDVAQLVLGDMRQNIKRALYNDMLGNPDKTPASATEVAERMADLSRRIGSAFGRLQAELVQPVLQRVIYILKKQGRIEIPQVNGREVKVRSVSPLAQAQSNQDIGTVSRFLELIGGTFGPEMLQILIDSEVTAVYLAKKFGVPESLIRDEEDRKAMTAMAQQMAQQQAAQQPQEQMGGPETAG